MYRSENAYTKQVPHLNIYVRVKREYNEIRWKGVIETNSREMDIGKLAAIAIFHVVYGVVASFLNNGSF